MRYIIERKMSNTGTIHDLASDLWERVISGCGSYAVVDAAFYGGKGYTTHKTAAAAIRASERRARAGYSHQIIDADGNIMDAEDLTGWRLSYVNYYTKASSKLA